MGFSEDLVRGSVEPIILSLVQERPMYGYEIVKVVNERTGGRLEWKEGTLYPALHRLETAGLVRSYWQEASDSQTGRKRKYYVVTSRGLAELKRRAKEWQEFSTSVNAMLPGA